VVTNNNVNACSQHSRQDMSLTSSSSPAMSPILQCSTSSDLKTDLDTFRFAPCDETILQTEADAGGSTEVDAWGSTGDQ
jgi:hypothetical protein